MTRPHVEDFEVATGAFAATLLDAADRYADPALQLNKRAFGLAKEMGDPNLEKLSAARILLAATLLQYRSVQHNDKATAIKANGEIQAMSRLFDANQLMRLWDATDSYHAGHAAGAAGQLSSSIWYFDRALELNPQYEEAYLYRGNAKMHQVGAAALETRDPALVCTKKSTLEEGIRDLQQALSLNQGTASAVEAMRKSRDPRDRYGIAADEAKQKALEDRRGTATQMYSAARYLLLKCN